MKINDRVRIRHGNFEGMVGIVVTALGKYNLVFVLHEKMTMKYASNELSKIKPKINDKVKLSAYPSMVGYVQAIDNVCDVDIYYVIVGNGTTYALLRCSEDDIRLFYEYR